MRNSIVDFWSNISAVLFLLLDRSIFVDPLANLHHSPTDDAYVRHATDTSSHVLRRRRRVLFAIETTVQSAAFDLNSNHLSPPPTTATFAVVVGVRSFIHRLSRFFFSSSSSFSRGRRRRSRQSLLAASSRRRHYYSHESPSSSSAVSARQKRSSRKGRRQSRPQGAKMSDPGCREKTKPYRLTHIHTTALSALFGGAFRGVLSKKKIFIYIERGGFFYVCFFLSPSSSLNARGRVFFFFSLSFVVLVNFTCVVLYVLRDQRRSRGKDASSSSSSRGNWAPRSRFLVRLLPPG